MDWVIGLALLLSGGIIGFFVARQVYQGNEQQNSSKQTERALKELLAQQAAQHLHQSRYSLDAIQQQCDALRQEMNAYEQLLETETADDDQPSLSFFGEHASAYLRNKHSTAKRNKSATDVQPRDFANTGSGLFDGRSSAAVEPGNNSKQP
ncbi:ZapG family protein [Aestuariibacter salexigens]|uniref:ZapG family protein n=1 Tax=Aestuariibacter salexigens TaxID=226010 RepID=UPI00040A10E8|nr:DUF1043 family protein [Aestuariibacter salexigens]